MHSSSPTEAARRTRCFAELRQFQSQPRDFIHNCGPRGSCEVKLNSYTTRRATRTRRRAHGGTLKTHTPHRTRTARTHAETWRERGGARGEGGGGEEGGTWRGWRRGRGSEGRGGEGRRGGGVVARQAEARGGSGSHGGRRWRATYRAPSFTKSSSAAAGQRGAALPLSPHSRRRPLTWGGWGGSRGEGASAATQRAARGSNETRAPHGLTCSCCCCSRNNSSMSLARTCRARERERERGRWVGAEAEPDGRPSTG